MTPDGHVPFVGPVDPPPAAAIVTRVLDILATVTETAEVRVRPDIDLFETGLLDSLRTVDLIVAMSAEFGIELAPSEFERSEWATPSRIVAYMQQRVGG